MSILDVVAVVVIVGYVIGRQLLGEHLRGKRLIVLPVVLVALGLSQLVGHHPGAADIALIAVSAIVASAIGVAQGALLHLETRDGTLWGQMPLRSLWLWTALVGSRIVVDVIAHGIGAPEKNGSTFLGDVFATSSAPANSLPTSSSPLGAAGSRDNGWQSGLRLLAERISTHVARR
jgi:hypothetical protein